VLLALLLQVLFSVRSERQLVEQLDYNLLLRWFVGLGMDDAMWNHAVFSKNRDRLLNSKMGAAVLCRGKPAGEAIYVGRSLHRRWHSDPDLGVEEELPPQGRFG
jgi:transposase